MAISFLYLGVGIVVLLFLKRLITSLRGNRLPLLPGPAPLPLIGNLHQAPKEHPWVQYHTWGKEHGPAIHLNMAGQPVVVINTFDAAQELLSKRGINYSDRPRLVVAGELVTKGLHILLRTYDAAYRMHQRMESPVLNPRAASSYRPIQDLESKQLLFDLLSSYDSAGDVGVDFNHWFERMTASTIYALIYGYRLKTGREKELLQAKHVQIEAVKKIEMGAHLVDLYPVLNYLPAPLAPWKKEGEALWQLERTLHLGNMNRALANPGWNFTKHMKASKEAQNMSDEELAFDAGVLADAALDTTTMTLDWFIVAWLTDSTGFVAKAKSLIDEVVGRDRLPQFEDQSRLIYIMAIIHEVMRWRPVVPGGVPHRYSAKTDDEYHGHRIPSGSIIVANHWGIGRDESVFGENVDDFVPERWLADKNESDGKDQGGLKDLHAPGFGFGRRACTGRHIAKNMLFITIARLLWAFDIEPAVDSETGKRRVVDPIACTPGFAVRPQPFNVEFRPRDPGVRKLIAKECSTHSFDLVALLDQAAADRAVRL